MMKTFAERYKESIVNLSKEELIQQRDIILNHIEAQRERLHIVSNENLSDCQFLRIQIMSRQR